MIDRIVAQVEDVEKEYIVRRLELKKDPTRDKDQVERFVGNIKGLKEKKSDTHKNNNRIKVHYYPLSGLLRLDGSLHTFAHGYNNTLFTCKDARDAMKKLALIIGVELDRFFFTLIEFGINMFMPKGTMKYIDQIFSYNNKKFLPMTPLKSTVYGVRCKAYNYEIKLYDKSYDAWIKKRIERTDNILRFEVMMRKQYAADNGFDNINAKGLLGKIYFIKMRKILCDILSDFDLDGKYLDYSNPTLNPKDVEKYMFFTSESYKPYLEFLSEYEKIHGKSNLRENAVTRKRRLMKKLKLMLTSDLIDEFKNEFHKTLELVSDRKSKD